MGINPGLILTTTQLYRVLIGRTVRGRGWSIAKSEATGLDSHKCLILHERQSLVSELKPGGCFIMPVLKLTLVMILFACFLILFHLCALINVLNVTKCSNVVGSHLIGWH